jgi:hypothetical protein
MYGTWRLPCVFVLLRLVLSLAAITEEERIEGYHARNYSWPPSKYVPDTPGWRALKAHRFTQISFIPDAADRYQAYAMMAKSAFLLANFTEFGFGLARAPEEVTATYQQVIRDGLPTAATKKASNTFLGPGAWFIERPDLNDRYLLELKPYVETWCKMPLVASKANGIRLYRNQSQLIMHLDKARANIISILFHVGSSEDADPWPLVVEDYLGQTHEVVQTAGDMLFLEGAKVIHGRPTKFSGSWYASVFFQYRPRGWGDTDHVQEAVFAIPPHWAEDPHVNEANPYPRIEMVGASYMETGCPNALCPPTIKWSGPAKDGWLIDPLLREHPFHPKEVLENDEL